MAVAKDAGGGELGADALQVAEAAWAEACAGGPQGGGGATTGANTNRYAPY